MTKKSMIWLAQLRFQKDTVFAQWSGVIYQITTDLHLFYYRAAYFPHCGGNVTYVTSTVVRAVNKLKKWNLSGYFVELAVTCHVKSVTTIVLHER